jgi:hypothetical protein
MEWDGIESRRAREADEAGCPDAGGGSTAAVGRGKPPPEHRWRKGQSGNPAGRPPKARASGSRGDRLLGADQPTRTMILTEAYRTVTIEEDGVRRKMPMNQAIWRAMGRAAMSGNRTAQHRFTLVVREMEREQLAAQVAIYNALERQHYRRDPNASFADDLVMDPTTGAVVVRGEAEG